MGPTLSLARRLQLLDWATQAWAWIIEDDYLGELQLRGRAAPALASLDRAGRVIHIGSFSETLSPTLRLGFVVVPPGNWQVNFAGVQTPLPRIALSDRLRAASQDVRQYDTSIALGR
jgi:DNA-binding transcriptional MocR family regulator